MHALELSRTHPRGSLPQELITCIEECYACAQSCTACADACLAEDGVAELRRCIRLNLDCAEVCATTGAVLSRQTETEWQLVATLLQACREACRRCAEECEQHAEHHRHCFECAEACRACEEACGAALAAVTA